MTANCMQIRPYPLGAHCEGDGIRFAYASAKDDCGIIVYDRETGRELEKIPFSANDKVGNVYYRMIKNYDPSHILYQFYEEDVTIPDPRAVLLGGDSTYGEEREKEDLRAGFITEAFDWEDDKNPRIPYEDCIGYLLHVRGFTKHVSSKVKEAYRGTFRGLMEKISYLQEIGVTTVELQPAYEFVERTASERNLNYWGYKKGFYYVPKAAYAADDPTVEFKELVKEFHKYGMEIVMQFYFPREVSVMEIPEILRYWVMEYHVDGFHLIGENLPADAIASDPLLANTKLWYERFSEEFPVCSEVAFYQDDYLCDMRKFLRGEEDTIKAVIYQMGHMPENAGRIHYMSNYYGMTLMDMVSYDRKHNEENGEDNRDGNNYNYSWNCGTEGDSDKQEIVDLRMRQIKNAMCMLLFSHSTPLIFMGDEFGNSQKGNNNPYCQDNDIAWIDWVDMVRNSELLMFWKQLIKIRKEHSVLHLNKNAQLVNSKAFGYPHLSYHGVEPWRPETENYSRCIGMMCCGKNAVANHNAKEEFFYIAMNMHWEEHTFSLPKLPEGMRWQMLLSTAPKNASDMNTIVSARSIAVFISVQAENDDKDGEI